MAFAPDALVPPEKVRPLRRAEYDTLVRSGTFGDERLELLYGRLVLVSPQGGPHVFSVTRLTKLLIRALGDRAEVRVQAPFAASDVSEPEPDLAVVPMGDYLNDHPGSAYLLIEVANTSVHEERRVKAPLYAAAGVPEYWIVDVVAGAIEVHRDPRDGSYRSVVRYGRAERVAVPGFEDVVVPVSDVVPPAP